MAVYVQSNEPRVADLPVAGRRGELRVNGYRVAQSMSIIMRAKGED